MSINPETFSPDREVARLTRRLRSPWRRLVHRCWQQVRRQLRTNNEEQK